VDKASSTLVAKYRRALSSLSESRTEGGLIKTPAARGKKQWSLKRNSKIKRAAQLLRVILLPLRSAPTL